jgi:hypothetical protein
MTPDPPRYAIYFSPVDGSPLAGLGAATLGYDASRGADAALAPGLEQQFPQWRRHVAEPARYGFHATLKAPFSLAQGFAEPDLVSAAAAVAGRLPPTPIGALEVAAMNRFVVLLPHDRQAGAALAAEIVSAFEPLRAPLSEAERARRLGSPLSARQIALLDRWGYPYVMDEFRFHMTLAGPLERELLAPACDALRRLYADVLDSLVIDAISIFKQESRSRSFVQLVRLRLSGGRGA